MSENCNHDCSNCAENCADRSSPQSFMAPQNVNSDVKHVIGVVSGKGGVGKSLVTSLLAAAMQKEGYQAAVLDADITGPSIPKVLGLREKATGTDTAIFPVLSKSGIEVMSINLLLPNESDPVVWRGPILGGTVKQFWTDVEWGRVDYMFVDMPPGTGDVPLTVFQSLPLAGIIVVTSPQELVSMIVEKAVKMAALMEIPVLGLVENMSYFECPDCGKRHSIFGESHIDELAERFGIGTVSKIPVDPRLASLCDEGRIEYYQADCLKEMVERLQDL